SDVAGEKTTQFTEKERHYYNRALQCYDRAFKCLQTRDAHQECWDSINWELCSTYLMMGSLLQDTASTSSKSSESIERELVTVFEKAERLCQIETSSARQPLYQYRLATIHHRLA